MTEPHVTVMRDRYVRGWPAHEQGMAVYPLPLSQALQRTYATDAHFVAYASPNGRRLTAEAIGKVSIELSVFMLDVDCAQVHGSIEPVPELWREDLAEKYWALCDDHPGAYLYHTRGGARIVYTCEPSIIATHADAQQWSREYAIVVAYMAERYGIHADGACLDWQRLYRLPKATRTEGGNPEAWPTLGDPDGIGALKIRPKRKHVAAAKLAAPRVFGRGPRAQAASYGYSGDGRGLLYHALRARGHVVRDHRLGHVVVCPNSEQHTTGRDGDGSTLLYPPGSDHRLGWLDCKHAHCAAFGANDWLELFSDTELDAAKHAGGLDDGHGANNGSG